MTTTDTRTRAARATAREAKELARQRRIELRRGQILEAAAHIMYRTGFHDMSMQAVAEQAGMSVGLIYSYFEGKHEVLEAVVVDILDRFGDRVPSAIHSAGDDPEAQLRAGFAAFCAVIDERREAVLLTYRESQTLTSSGRRTIIRLEQETIQPLADTITAGIEAGVFRSVSVPLVTHNLKMAAHSWALKQWDLARRMTLQEYVDAEMDLILAGLRA